jgi:undecaprenyl-diphosphatase
VFTLDALVHPRAFYDLEVLRAVQRIDLPMLATVIQPVDWLTDGLGAVLMWVLVLVVFVSLRWRGPALVMLAMPAGGAITFTIDRLVDRAQLDPAVIERIAVDAGGPHYPSGHVVGAVMLYGYLFVMAGRIRPRAVRLAVRCGAVLMIGVVGFTRVWYGGHWPSDVLGGYALGGLMLVVILALDRHITAVTLRAQPTQDTTQELATRLS